MTHTGLVYKVDNLQVYTVEGNTSSAKGVVSNGGCVRLKSYKLTSSSIDGYGRPAYTAEELGTSNTSIEKTVDLYTKEYNKTAKIVKDVAAAAVLVMSMFSAVIGMLIFIPKIMEVLGWN